MTAEQPIGHGRRRATAIERSADVALAAAPVPLRVLDVGCGDGALLREVVVRVPNAGSYVGIDPSPRLVADARRDSDARIDFQLARPEALPFGDAEFDLVVSSLSFDGWTDQRRGVEELARVVTDAGTVVLVDAAVWWLRGGGRARAPKAVTGLLADAGLRVRRRESVLRRGYLLPFIRAFIASR